MLISMVAIEFGNRFYSCSGSPCRGLEFSGVGVADIF